MSILEQFGDIPIKINFVAVIKLLIRLFKKKKEMCFKKIAEWFEPDPVIDPVEDVNYLALLFGINDYMGYNNDLNGCVNDVNDVEAKLKAEFPAFVVRKFIDSQVTIQRFIDEVESALAKVKKVLYIHYSGHGTQIGTQEALYLYNGPLMDDVICDFQNKTPDYLTVVAKFDSCFSGGMDDRKLNPHGIKNRFYQIPGAKPKKIKKHFGRGDVAKWVIFSACGEFQTAADCYFDGRPNGAFTYNDNKSYMPASTYAKEYNLLRTKLPSGELDQIPELTGDSNKHNNLVLT